MSEDDIKDRVLQYVLELQEKRPNQHIGFPKVMITRGLAEELAGSRKETVSTISLAVDYLEDERFLKTQTQQGVKFYRLSSKAQDKLLTPSAYGRSSSPSSKQDDVRVFGDGSIIVLGDNYGTITFDKRKEINNSLQELVNLIQATGDVTEEEKADLVQNVRTLDAQIKKPTPDKTIVQRAWQSMQGAATISGAAQLIGQLKPLIEALTKGLNG